MLTTISFEDLVINYLAIYNVYALFGPTFLCYFIDVDGQSEADISVKNGTELEESFTDVTKSFSNPNLILNMSHSPAEGKPNFTQYCSTVPAPSFYALAMFILFKFCLIWREFRGYKYLSLVFIRNEIYNIVVSKQYILRRYLLKY